MHCLVEEKLQALQRLADRLNHRVDAGLYHRGFTVSEVRAMVRGQLLLSLYASCAAPMFLLTGWWPLDFIAGAALASFNFYYLAKFVQQVLYFKYTRGLLFGLLFRSYGRLLLTGVALCVLIGWLNSSIVALVAGLSTVVATVLVWGAARVLGQKVKEA